MSQDTDTSQKFSFFYKKTFNVKKIVHDLFYRKNHNSRKSFFFQKCTTLKITPWSDLSHGEKDILQRRISELKLWLTEKVNKAI